MTYELKEREGIMADSGINSIEGAFEDTEAWRVATEARHCLDFYSLEERRRFLKVVEKHRGEAGRKSLEAAIMTEWNSRKAHQAKKEAA